MRFHFAPSGREALPPAGQELLFLRCPRPETQDGDDWASQVPGRPPCPHALLLDPGGTSAPGHLRRLSVAFRLSATASASTTAPISGLNHTAYELAVYASCATLAADHARLASGCWPTFAGRECLPAGPRKKVSKMSSTFYISSSLSRLNLAHRAAGASAQRGIRRAIEAASGRVARRCAARRRSRASTSDVLDVDRLSFHGFGSFVHRLGESGVGMNGPDELLGGRLQP